MTKFNRDQLVGIYKTINEISKDKLNKFVLFALDKNRTKLQEVVDELSNREASLYTEEYKAYDTARVDIIKKYAVRGEDGEIVITNDNATIKPESISEAEAELKELESRFAETLSTYKESVDEFRKFINETVDFEFTKIAFKFIPDDLSGKEFALFKLLLKETDEELEGLLG